MNTAKIRLSLKNIRQRIEESNLPITIDWEMETRTYWINHRRADGTNQSSCDASSLLEAWQQVKATAAYIRSLQ